MNIHAVRQHSSSRVAQVVDHVMIHRIMSVNVVIAATANHDTIADCKTFNLEETKQEHLHKYKSLTARAPAHELYCLH